ncbi:MAG TPA: helix-turn-helix domain-containing protein [Pseudonocardiaceae bacterium]|nr:helix-turn-helix domain-containing protein [Pseudonocardiaceae bacterium]
MTTATRKITRVSAEERARQVRLIATRYQSGESIHDISRALRMPYSTVYNRLRAANVEMRPVGDTRKPCPIAKVPQQRLPTGIRREATVSSGATAHAQPPRSYVQTPRTISYAGKGTGTTRTTTSTRTVIGGAPGVEHREDALMGAPRG